jgi:nicotinamidase/pyrazinamidase
MAIGYRFLLCAFIIFVLFFATYRPIASLGGGDVRALIIVDVQNDFTSGGALAVPSGDDIIPVINELRSRYYGNGFDVILLSQDWHPSNHVSFASQHRGYKMFSAINLTYTSTGDLCRDEKVLCSYAKNCSTALADETRTVEQKLWPDHCVIDSEGAKFHPHLVTRDEDHIVRKGSYAQIDSYSAFYDNGRFASTSLDELLKSHHVTSLYVVGLATDYCVSSTAIDAVSLGYQTTLILDATRGVSADTSDAAIANMKSLGISLVNSTALSDIFTASESSVSTTVLLLVTAVFVVFLTLVLLRLAR